MTNFEQLPSRIRHYLLDWKDIHLEEYCNKYGELKLRDLTKSQLLALFSYAVTKDYGLKEWEESNELTYEERVRWFITNFYETGMEYEGMLRSMKNEDLDNFKWYNDFIKIPKYRNEL